MLATICGAVPTLSLYMFNVACTLCTCYIEHVEAQCWDIKHRIDRVHDQGIRKIFLLNQLQVGEGG